MKKETINLKGLDCPDCASKLDKAINHLPGIKHAQILFSTGKLRVEYDPQIISSQEMAKKLKQLGHGPSSEPLPTNIFTYLCGVALVAAFLFNWQGNQTLMVSFALMAIILGGYGPLKFVLHTRAFDMHLLMTIAVVGAALIGEWMEGATVIFLFSLGELLESHTMDKTRRGISDLMELAPKEATVQNNGVSKLVPLEEVVLGATILIKPGERIPMDGQVSSGYSSINQAPITGESLPVDKHKGDLVYAGTINGFGSLEVQVTKHASDTTLAKIVHLVEEAQNQRAPMQKFVDVFAKYYTPTVITIALITAVIPPVLWGQTWSEWIYRSLALLVVACPCALVISTPVSIISAIGNGASRGILIKGGAHLEAIGRIKAIALDKTGTLTYGQPKLTQVIAMPGYSKKCVLSIAAGLESLSEHPIAQAIVQAAEQQGLTIPKADNFQAHLGLGVSAHIADTGYLLGTCRLFPHAKLPKKQIIGLEKQGQTVIILGTHKHVLGIMAVSDEIRPTSRQAIKDLRRAGIQKIIMLTGDNAQVAQSVCSQLGIDEFKARLLPEDKVDAIIQLQKQYGQVAMVGDGINDAPALAKANVGIAMGAAGSDTALEVAHMALMGDDLSTLAQGVDLSRKTLGIIKQNIAFSLLVKLIALALIFPGWLTLWLAILSDTGAALLVIANGMRLLIHKSPFQSQ